MGRKPAALESKRSVKSGAEFTRTWGPVSDLERHLPSDWWKTLFNSLYLKTDGDVVENTVNTKQEVDLVTQVAILEPNDYILDLCCGQGRHSIELGRRGFRHIIGVDRSRYLIRLARKRAKNENVPVLFHEGDARMFRLKNQRFHCVMLLGNSFGYFDQKSDDEALLNNVAYLLVPNGVLVLDIVDGEWMHDNFEPRSWEWIDENHFVCRERALTQDGERIVTRELISHAEKGVIADQFYAERLYMRNQLRDVLETCGYRMIHFHKDFESNSTRGQDLGMMAHRLLLTAQAPKRTVKVSRKTAPLFPNVTIILGDPILPDKVKLNGKFNTEDFDTVHRLKQALDELDEYTFTYMDNHQSLFRSLMKNPPDFVLNFCDEGFKNDPFMEMHIPAILEMLDIPYTGAGPTCLGLCYDKNLTRAVAESVEIPVPLESYLGPEDFAATLPATFPALVKPNFGDSSMGITQKSVVSNTVELLNYIEWIRSMYGKCSILVQEFLTGTEYSIGIVGNPGLTLKVLCPIEVDYSALDTNLPPILSYESKWHPDSPYWYQISYKKSELSEDKQRLLIDYSSMLFERLGCCDYARFDFRADKQGTIKLLEVNPNPGWCWDGKMNIMAGFEDLRYADLLRMILEAGQERFASR